MEGKRVFNDTRQKCVESIQETIRDEAECILPQWVSVLSVRVMTSCFFFLFFSRKPDPDGFQHMKFTVLWLDHEVQRNLHVYISNLNQASLIWRILLDCHRLANIRLLDCHRLANSMTSTFVGSFNVEYKYLMTKIATNRYLATFPRR